ncbi:hypothetical protein TAMA11512_09120 [Selenomonas sp. TAMA-11512]|uniref:hypothetical protein n=1 Tax=Selenomonas sp. TAMA-11512 TaxID=3095337 RepID=UPI00308DA45B|nr:hypothetical protein TAMA11512_09120 [Selenomonas sp. TAMA-11512]
MCTGKKNNSAPAQAYTPPRVDPAPTVVQASDVGTETAAKSQKRRHGRASTMLSSDRGTILGTLAGGDGRTTLG